jgi:hypothetical protein
MSNSKIVEALFPELCISGSAAKILDLLAKHGIRNLAYDGDCGRNPGYIFRGELDFQSPLQCSLERRLRDELKAGETLTAQQLREKERRLITNFIRGDGGLVAATIDNQSGQKISQPVDDVFWWLSLMQHYGHPTRLIDFTRDIRLALFFAVEQLRTRRKNGKSEKDLMIYCFPCKDLTRSDDESSNKTPIAPSENGIDMNRAVGCLIELEWMLKHTISEKRSKQLFGWDRPSYQNPRLRFQRGMFVYPYDYPRRCLKNNDESWLVQNLRAKAADTFNLNAVARDLPAKRIRIAFEHAADLKTHLKQRYSLTPATVYVDYARADIEVD